MRHGLVWWAAVVAWCAGLGVLPGQILYTADGEPTPIEEEIRWQLNRGRFDTSAENARRGTSYTDVPATAGPVAPNEALTIAARHQSEDLARTGLFQHATVPGSAFYDPVTQPDPWDRMEAEGYQWNEAAENIAAGYPGSLQAYVGWWNSSGHRHGMYGESLREIGTGYFFLSGSPYGRYYTMDLGSSGNADFFTDTLFRDLNGDGDYSGNEGVAGVAVKLMVKDVLHASYDRSSAVGSFAVPLQPIPRGAVVQVVISNSTANALSLSIPTNAIGFASVNLAAGEARVYGQFNRPAGTRNVGWREVTPSVAVVVPPVVSIRRASDSVILEWGSDISSEYLPQVSVDLVSWTPLTAGFLPGTGGVMQFGDTAGGGLKFYRVQARGR